jgi:hypothetical protein
MAVFALQFNTTGIWNTACGAYTLSNNTDGSRNTAGLFVTTANNVIAIGTAGANVSDSCYIKNIANNRRGQAVYVNKDGKLGYQVSSRRFKEDIKPIKQASEAIYGLKPVSFRYKPEIEPTRPLGFGLIAEDVEEVSPDLVTCGSDGNVGSVRYDAVNAMLLNEFLKEHRKVQKLQATLDAVNKRLKEQDVKIQRVNARLELNKRAPQMVQNQ